MRDGQIAVLDTMIRVQQFLDANPDELATIAASIRKQLDDVVKQLSDYAVAQDGAARGGIGETARQHALRSTLRRNYMRPIAKLARLKLRSVPEFAALTLPGTSTTPQRLVAAAYARGDAASAHVQVFIDNGLPSTFIDDLRAAAAAVSASVAGRGQHLTRRSGATAGLIEEEKRGRTILQVLDALIMAHVVDNLPLIAEWNASKMIRRKPGRVSGGQTKTPVVAPVLIASAGTTTPTLPVLVPTPEPTLVTNSTLTHDAVTAPMGVAA